MFLQFLNKQEIEEKKSSFDYFVEFTVKNNLDGTIGKRALFFNKDDLKSMDDYCKIRNNMGNVGKIMAGFFLKEIEHD